MDLQSRMLQLWVIASAAWLAHWSWATWNTCGSDAAACAGVEHWIDLAVSAFGVPVAALLVGAAIVWGMAGVRRAN